MHWWTIGYNEGQPHDALEGLTPAEYMAHNAGNSTLNLSLLWGSLRLQVPKNNLDNSLRRFSIAVRIMSLGHLLVGSMVRQ